MLIYKDVFTGDELASDSFPMQLVDGIIFEFKGKSVVRKEGDVVLDGANASAEGEDAGEDCVGGEESGIDFVLNHKLDRMNFYETKKNFLSYMKGYMKKVVDHMEANKKSEDEVKEFKGKIADWVKDLATKRFDKLEIYIGPKMAEGEGEGQLAIVEWRDTDQGEFPILLLVKEGLDIEKC